MLAQTAPGCEEDGDEEEERGRERRETGA